MCPRSWEAKSLGKSEGQIQLSDLMLVPHGATPQVEPGICVFCGKEPEELETRRPFGGFGFCVKYVMLIQIDHDQLRRNTLMNRCERTVVITVSDCIYSMALIDHGCCTITHVIVTVVDCLDLPCQYMLYTIGTPNLQF